MSMLAASAWPATLVERLWRTHRILATALGMWAGGWCVYYGAQELKRYYVLAARRRRHPLRQRQGSDAAWFGKADEDERRDIVGRFRSMRFCGRYLNVTPEWREQGMWEWMWWKCVHSVIWNRGAGYDGGFSEDLRRPDGRARIEALLPVEPLDTEELWSTSRGAAAAPCARAHGASFTWLGQSTCLVQLHGVTILTDPVFGDQPIESVLSPRRMRPMPCTLDELVALGSIDVVLVSHNHFDHLDLSVVARVPPTTHWIVPTNVGSLLTSRGVAASHVHELDWWDECALELDVCVRSADGAVRVPRRVAVSSVPASHWSARSPLDTNRSLWSSYAVRCHADAPAPASLFFCGDSGYSASLFTAIGRLHGPFDVAAIPIGSYEPRWHLSLQHMDPHGSVRVARDVGARRAYGMHWGTWCMSGAYAD